MTETLAHYTLLEPIGVGAIGTLHRARDTKSGRTVALRIVDSSTIAAADRGADLVRALGQATELSHPNLAAIYEVGEDLGRVYYAQEFVPGTLLSTIAEGHPLNARRALGYAIEIADALAEAEARAIVHGHLTAASVIVTPKGRAKLLDTGFAQWTRGGAGSPEHDVVALGRLLTALVTGPPGGASPGTMPAELAPIVEQCIDRGYDSPATAAAVLREVAEALEAGAAVVSVPPSARSADRSSHILRWVVVLVLVAAATAIIWIAARS